LHICKNKRAISLLKWISATTLKKGELGSCLNLYRETFGFYKKTFFRNKEAV